MVISGFGIWDLGFQIPDSRFQIPRFQIPRFQGFQDSRFQDSKDSKDFRFHGTPGPKY
ncbi:MAG: hypothetical protein IPN69_04675 [Acidobacteria bacterium]|nr:hypothetical protein [Acidobacteriota bacterium]